MNNIYCKMGASLHRFGKKEITSASRPGGGEGMFPIAKIRGKWIVYIFSSNSCVFISIFEKATGSKVRAEDKS